MMLSASNALCRDRIAYHKLRRFSFTLNAVVTVVMIVLIAPPVFDWSSAGSWACRPKWPGWPADR